MARTSWGMKRLMATGAASRWPPPATSTADGFADLIVGALLADPHGNLSSGASYIVFGKASGFAANIDLSNLNGTTGFELSGEAADEQSGFSVASAGGSPSATAHRSTPRTSCSCE
jgi:hypothetical protein